MEGTKEGLAIAAATREAASKKRHADDESAPPSQPAAEVKKPAVTGNRPPPTCTHEVAVPEGFNLEAHAAKFDPKVHGRPHE